ncbi:FadR family transcriptional regulator [Aneurinibacillus aneurinilyticus]|uniref:FadR family transcriptional regulator n=1 Tax=Aneurinibacillus aneurinilyticus TaxID=1391 RepID=A0A848CTZ3_ANEAE|nr:FadR/GntR family transcriptional regulator [Aneurinibacillus aneurinilyticus]NME97417.1 FadR family transcriptional regulator [Aneurinibacillus aneurinilyticus]
MFGGICVKLRQATRLTLVDQVVAQMDELIQSGEWPVGKRIPAEPELVNQLGVSRNTVREAVRALVHTGLLETRQGDGTYVCSSSELGAALLRRLQRSTIVETLEVRYALEQEAARLAAARRTPEDIEALRECLASCSAAKDVEAYIQADMKLHQAIVNSTHNRFLADLYEHMNEAIKVSIGSTVEYTVLSELHEDMQLHDKVHSDLVTAIIDGEPEASAGAVRAHIQLSQDVLLEKDNKEK